MTTQYLITYEMFTNESKKKKPVSDVATELTFLNPVDFYVKKLKSKKWDGCVILNVFVHEEADVTTPGCDQGAASYTGSVE